VYSPEDENEVVSLSGTVANATMGLLLVGWKATRCDLKMPNASVGPASNAVDATNDPAVVFISL